MIRASPAAVLGRFQNVVSMLSPTVKYVSEGSPATHLPESKPGPNEVFDHTSATKRYAEPGSKLTAR